ncbi:hypothetical protein PIB30_067855 [Stylosanthes scabra]|uniref:Uncharacterized protein n=1 Tax=Stylosanthes scabra TaxID=79078 RepID=A0ABU6TPB4_9FABA|nr:hypothetical protein [Stylosanthes scabra]
MRDNRTRRYPRQNGIYVMMVEMLKAMMVEKRSNDNKFLVASSDMSPNIAGLPPNIVDLRLMQAQEILQPIVAGVRSIITDFHDDLGILHHAGGSLDERLATLSGMQDDANHGWAYLIDFVYGKTRKPPEFLRVGIQERLMISANPIVFSHKGAPSLMLMYHHPYLPPINLV